MKTVSLRTDPDIYEKLKLICIINRENVYDVLTDLMKKYVSDNEDTLNSIRAEAPMELPDFFGDQYKWFDYVNKIDKNTFGDIANRNYFLRYLLHYYATQHNNDVELYEKLEFKEFKKSKDFEFLTQNHIYSTVQGLKPMYAGSI